VLPEVLILRDPRESVRKCSLTPLRGLPGIAFVDFAVDRRISADGRVLLHPDGEELTDDDAGRGLLLVDCAWRRVPRLLRSVDGQLRPRRLPRDLATAYPRRSKTFEDPEAGLASVEALYAATCLLGAPRSEWLATYRWREGFLVKNPRLRGA